MAKRVEITLGKDGSVKVEAFNFKGASCEDATAFLQKVLGKAENTEHKDSYYEENTEANFDVDGLPGGHCG